VAFFYPRVKGTKKYQDLPCRRGEWRQSESRRENIEDRRGAAVQQKRGGGRTRGRRSTGARASSSRRKPRLGGAARHGGRVEQLAAQAAAGRSSSPRRKRQSAEQLIAVQAAAGVLQTFMARDGEVDDRSDLGWPWPRISASPSRFTAPPLLLVSLVEGADVPCLSCSSIWREEVPRARHTRDPTRRHASAPPRATATPASPGLATLRPSVGRRGGFSATLPYYRRDVQTRCTCPYGGCTARGSQPPIGPTVAAARRSTSITSAARNRLGLLPLPRQSPWQVTCKLQETDKSEVEECGRHAARLQDSLTVVREPMLTSGMRPGSL
jgi:hypothetical protein